MFPFSSRLIKLTPLAGAIIIIVGSMLVLPILTGEGHHVNSDRPGGFWDSIKQKRTAGPIPPDSPSLVRFKTRLAAENRDLGVHGVYVESLASQEVIAAFNENVLLNPASVIKIATSIAALDKLGANYVFRTEFRVTGEINPATRELAGDLVVVTGGDPSFSLEDARQVGVSLRAAGINRIKGNLVISGAFICNDNSQTDVSAGVLRRNMGLPVSGTLVLTQFPAGQLPGRKLFEIKSQELIRILQDQNAHSINVVADAVGDAIGGAEAVRRFLVERIGLKENEVFITRASGLETNRLSATGTAMIIRGVIAWLEANGYHPQDLLPVGGIGSSTIAGRFSHDGYAGSVVAKTGTLHETDNGAANLAGIAYTRNGGPILFVLYDMAEGRSPAHLRQIQDELLKGIITELGGPDPVANSTAE